MLAFDNPVFATFVIGAALGVVKVMAQGWITVAVMMRAGRGFASPEDLQPGALNPTPTPDQLAPHDGVERSRRMHRNDLENIPAFWMAGLLFVLADPPLLLAQGLIWGFVAARAAHFVVYASARSHEMRATFYTIGSLIVIYMALHALTVALF